MTGEGDREVELKLEVAPSDVETLSLALVDAGFALGRKVQRSTYFDTPDRRLREAGVSLRIRTVRGKRTQTIKGDARGGAGLFSREEWERVVPDDTPVVEGPLATLLPGDAAAALAPVFTVEVTRRAAVAVHGGARIEVAVDLGRAVAADRIENFAEIELELLDGPSDALFALARLLGGVAPVRLGVLTKSSRGYRLVDGAADRVAKATAGLLSGSPNAATAFQGIVAACLAQFRLNEDLLLRTGRADALHQARVALRRLRSALSIFRPLVADERFDHLRGELRWLAAVLGEGRDIDVLIARGETDPVLQEARGTAYAAVADALASSRVRTLMLELAEWSSLGTWRSAPANGETTDQPAARFAAETLDRLRRRIRKRGHKLHKLDDEQRHRVRIDAKKLRYAAEFFAGLFPGRKASRRAGRFLDALQALQQILGDLNDIAAEPAIRERWGLPAGERDMSSARAGLIGEAADAHGDLIERKRFWR